MVQFIYPVKSLVIQTPLILVFSATKRETNRWDAVAGRGSLMSLSTPSTLPGLINFVLGLRVRTPIEAVVWAARRQLS